MTRSLAEVLPHWDTATIYSSLEGDDYRAAVEQMQSRIAEFESFVDAHGIRRTTQNGESDLADTLAEALEQANELTRLWSTLHSFVYTFVSTDSYNAEAAR